MQCYMNFYKLFCRGHPKNKVVVKSYYYGHEKCKFLVFWCPVVYYQEIWSMSFDSISRVWRYKILTINMLRNNNTILWLYLVPGISSIIVHSEYRFLSYQQTYTHSHHRNPSCGKCRKIALLWLQKSVIFLSFVVYSSLLSRKLEVYNEIHLQATNLQNLE